MMRGIGTRLVRYLLLALAFSSCLPAGAGDPGRRATVAAISLAVRSTATADALSGGASLAAARTAEAQAAANIQSIQAAQTNQAPPPAGNLAQTQTALPIQSQLPFYG
ncbi:MAG: hypothetical protein EHM21_05080, partial [Chloroflexi bacterium]